MHLKKKLEKKINKIATQSTATIQFSMLTFTRQCFFCFCNLFLFRVIRIDFGGFSLFSCCYWWTHFVCCYLKWKKKKQWNSLSTLSFFIDSPTFQTKFGTVSFLWLCLSLNFYWTTLKNRIQRGSLTHQFIDYLTCNRFPVNYSNILFIWLACQSFLMLRKKEFSIDRTVCVLNVWLFAHDCTFKLSAVFVQRSLSTCACIAES